MFMLLFVITMLSLVSFQTGVQMRVHMRVLFLLPQTGILERHKANCEQKNPVQDDTFKGSEAQTKVISKTIVLLYAFFLRDVVQTLFCNLPF